MSGLQACVDPQTEMMLLELNSLFCVFMKVLLCGGKMASKGFGLYPVSLTTKRKEQLEVFSMSKAEVLSKVLIALPLIACLAMN